MLTVTTYLARQGREYPKPNADGSITGQDFADAGLPMIVACTGCEMTMVLTPDRPCSEDGLIYCQECGGAS